MIKITVLDLYTADCTKTDLFTAPTYSTPAKLSTVNKVAVALNKSSNKIYESGLSVYNKTFIADAKVTVDVHTLSHADRMELFYNKTSEGTGGFEEAEVGDAPKNVALGWAVQIDDSGTTKYLCTWFYDAAAVPNDETYNTSNENGPQIDPDSIEFSCVRRPGDRKLRRTKLVTTTADMATFFATVEPAVQQQQQDP